MSGLETAMAAVGGLVNLGDKLASAKGEAEKNAALVEFQRAIIKAQGEAMSLQNQLASANEELQRLRQELAARDDWAAECAKYELREVSRGVFCQVPTSATGSPKSWVKLCARCFEHRQRSLLQHEMTVQPHEGRMQVLSCKEPSCKATLKFHGFLEQPA